MIRMEPNVKNKKLQERVISVRRQHHYSKIKRPKHKSNNKKPTTRGSRVLQILALISAILYYVSRLVRAIFDLLRPLFKGWPEL